MAFRATKKFTKEHCENFLPLGFIKIFRILIARQWAQEAQYRIQTIDTHHNVLYLPRLLKTE